MRDKQARAELSQAQAQQGYHAEATTKQILDYKSWNLFWALGDCNKASLDYF